MTAKKITEGYRAIYEGTQSVKGLSGKSLRKHSRIQLEDRAVGLFREGLPDEAVSRAVGLPVAHIEKVRARRERK